jgi:glyoxylase-like metal-dependent hydrolase (beta-lactamase superfamily II)
VYNPQVTDDHHAGHAAPGTNVRLRVSMFDTGYCRTRASFVARGTGWHAVSCHAPVFLLQHPQYGATLFDTGYAPRLAEAFRHWPARLYKYATPTTFGIPAVEQLNAAGVPASQVSRVIVSHLHADHVAGLRDFPHSQLIITAAALTLQQQVRGIDAVRRGIIQELFPDDFAKRAAVIHAFNGAPLPALGGTHDLHGDGSVLLMALPGHARGQMGALVRGEHGDVLLCADGAWTSRAWRELRPPHWLTGAMQDDTRVLRSTLTALRAFATHRPDVTILPTHCPETLRCRGGS